MDTIDLNEWMDRFNRIEKRVKSLELLSKFGKILNSTLDHDEVRRRAIEAATQLMKAEAGFLLLLDEGKDQLSFEVAIEECEEDIKKIKLNMGEGIAGWAAKNDQGLIVNNPEDDHRFFQGSG